MAYQIDYSTGFNSGNNGLAGLAGYNFGGWKQTADPNVFSFEGPMLPNQANTRNISDMVGMTGYNPNTDTSATITNPNGGGGLFGLNAGTLGAIGAGLQGLSGLASAYTGFKALQQAQDQFDFQKKLANRNIANQAKVINNTYDNAAQVAAGMIGGRDSSGNFGMTDQAIVDRYARKAKDKHVDGSSIG